MFKNYKNLIVLCCYQIARAISAPLPWMMQPQYQQLPWQPHQQQIDAIQDMQMQQFQPPMPFHWPQLIPMILLPVDNDIITFNSEMPNQDIFKRINDKHIFENERQKVLATSTPHHSEKNEEDDDTVVIEASEDNPTLPEQMVKKEQVKERIILLVPNGERFSIGGIIEAIPFLPFEVNVPDTIAWAWNGISNIISGIGQRLPFRPKIAMPIDQTEAVKVLIKNIETQNMLNSAMMPMQVLVMPVGITPVVQPQVQY